MIEKTDIINITDIKKYNRYQKYRMEVIMKRKDALSVREEELMNYLWNIHQPMTSTEMSEKLEPEGWNSVTLLKTIQSLADTGYLEVVGFEKSSKTYARKLMPSVTKEEYYSKVLMQKGINTDSLADITAALLGVSKKKRKERDEKVIEKLEEIIEELRKNSETDA